MRLFYLSFCDVNKPEGQKWIGGTYVESPDDESFLDMIRRGRREGWNPEGTEIASWEIDWAKRPGLKDSHVNRLLRTTDELMDADAEPIEGDYVMNLDGEVFTRSSG